ncbi:hypothetical protein NDU88_004550 [Pleurodeles waltl]|uniref:Uncharacterized protein n=1 Tax=Pleurodeles waltl TaxID=8319 RepID=A0AAV7TSR5_PLEWA|nr:hypothetical protein NDU88_004550 [Pleurodeles waltl]
MELHPRSGLVADLVSGADAQPLRSSVVARERRRRSKRRCPRHGDGRDASTSPARDWICCGQKPVTILCRTLRPSSTLMSILLDWCRDAALNHGTVNATVTSTVVCLDRSAMALGPLLLREPGDKIVLLLKGGAVSAREGNNQVELAAIAQAFVAYYQDLYAGGRGLRDWDLPVPALPSTLAQDLDQPMTAEEVDAAISRG